VSVVEHVPTQGLESFFQDGLRILKRGGLWLHAIDIYITDEPSAYWNSRYEAYRSWLLHPSLKPALEETLGVIVFQEQVIKIARDFAGTISKCVVRRDTPYPVFHGCVDWHSGVHGFYALTAVARTTADKKLLDWISGQLDAAGIAEERRALATDPNFDVDKLELRRRWYSFRFRRAATATTPVNRSTPSVPAS
jgi:hypothetical protein